MDKYNSILGLGQDTYTDEPWLGSGSGSASGGLSFTDKLSDWFGLAKEGADIFKTVKDGSQGGSTTYVLPPPAPPSNNAMKYALIGGGVLLATGIAVAIFTSSGKKKKLDGVPATAPKKAKKRKK